MRAGQVRCTIPSINEHGGDTGFDRQLDEGPRPLPKPLLLFLHGLGGDAKSTWGKFDSLIEADPALQNRIDVHFHSYPTSLFSFWPIGRSLKIQDISMGLRTELIHRFPNHDRILIVCHSLGGLVAKHFICDLVKSGSRPPVKGVIFFATPHTGATLAAVADRLSWRHYQVRQLRHNADFLNLVTEDWERLGCEAKLELVEYVRGGLDAVVVANSASPSGSRPQLISNKGHIDLVKPNDDSDLSYLIVKHATQKLFLSETGDLARLRDAIEIRDRNTITALVANHGRSWIETTEADSALELLQEIVTKFDPPSAEAVWSRYLIAISRLFRDRDVSSTALDDELIRNAQAIGLGPLIKAEVMEFARKRDDHEAAIASAKGLLAEIRDIEFANSPNNAYALGTAYFLLGNLYRFGGRYIEAKRMIERARNFFRPAILAHQIELAHCHYSYSVCRAMEGELRSEDIPAVPLAPEFRRFSEALITLALSHSAWSASKVDEAEALADRAAAAFGEIRFVAYARRARALSGLLGACYRLEYGADVEKAVASAQEYAPVIRGMIGDPAARGALRNWISRTRPSFVLGMLHFAAAFGGDSTSSIGEFELPPVLCIGDEGLRWRRQSCTSLAEADVKLRRMMGIPQTVRLPLLAD